MFQLFDQAVHLGVVVVGPLRPTNGDGAGEDGEKAVSPGQFGESVDGERGGEREDGFAAFGQAHVCDREAEDRAAEQITGNPPQAAPMTTFPISSQAAHCTIHCSIGPLPIMNSARYTNGKARASLSPASEVSANRTSSSS